MKNKELIAGGICFRGDDGRPWADSRIVAEKFEKQHNNVLRDIRSLDCSKEFHLLNFEQRNHINQRGQSHPHYVMTRDGFVFLAMGFTGANAALWKEKYIAAFNELENRVADQSSLNDQWVKAILSAQQKNLDALSGTAALQISRTNEVDSKVESLRGRTETVESKVVYLHNEMERLKSTSAKKRTTITDAVKNQLIYDLARMGGRCPCCRLVEIVDSRGNKTKECEFDHYSSVQRSSADYVWPICRSCHSELTNHKSHRIIDAGAHFAAFQQSRKRLSPGLF